MDEIKLGKYKHYKGHFYDVIGVGKHSETLEDMVIYKALYETDEYPIGTIWVRPKKIFIENIKVKGVITARFKFVDADEYTYEE